MNTQSFKTFTTFRAYISHRKEPVHTGKINRKKYFKMFVDIKFPEKCGVLVASTN